MQYKVTCNFGMVPAAMMPARSLPLAICAAGRAWPGAGAGAGAGAGTGAGGGRLSVPSMLRTLSAGQGSVVQVLESQSPFLRSSDWFALLEGLGRQNKWAVTLEVFRWMQRQKWYKHDDGFYSKLIVIMGKAKQLRMAVWLFNEVKRTGARPDTSLHNALITAYLSSKDKGRGFEKALQLFEAMKKKPKCQPNLVTYNILLRASAQACDVARVERFFQEMEASGIYPDLVSYNGVIGAYGKAGEYVQMEKTLFVMRMHKHIKPDNVTSNTLIESYGHGKDFVKMEQVLKSMRSSKSRQKPDLKTYNILMSSYARAGEVEKMERSFARMEAAGYKPNLRSFETLMTGYGDAGAFALMKECFYQIVEAGIQPQLSTLNVMMGAFCKHNLFEDAEELLSNVTEWRILPRTSSYLIILRAYAQENRISDIERVVERMRIAGIGATFLESLQSFDLSSGNGETLIEPAVEVPADDDVDVDVNYDDVAAIEETENSSSGILNLSFNEDE